MIVVDTNVLCHPYLTGNRSSEAEAAFKKDAEWVAPILWRSDFRNVLAMYLHQQLLSLPDALTMMQEAEGLMVGREYEVPSRQVLNLAESSRCSACDCEFVALASELGIPLVTVDDGPENSVLRTCWPDWKRKPNRSSPTSAVLNLAWRFGERKVDTTFSNSHPPDEGEVEGAEARQPERWSAGRCNDCG